MRGGGEFVMKTAQNSVNPLAGKQESCSRNREGQPHHDQKKMVVTTSSFAHRANLALACGLIGSLFLLPWNRSASAADVSAPLQGLHRRHLELHADFARLLTALAAESDERGLPEATTEIMQYATPPDCETVQGVVLPTQLEAPLSSDLPADERFWKSRLKALRNDYAAQLYLLSRQALHRGYPGYAYQLVHETARQNTDHKQARELLGFVQFGNDWVTPFARKMLREQHVWTTEFGWIKKANLARYQQGERYFGGRWMSAEKEGEHRRDFRNAWQVRTDHYLIMTNHSLEEGARLGVALEDFHRLFHETYAGFFSTAEQMRKLFDGQSPADRSGLQPFKVHYYRTREEYVKRLVDKFPQIAGTNGIYVIDDHVAHFFHADTNALDRESTLFHEATHQLFYESHPGNRSIGEDSHFWIIEGIACYMESFRRREGQFDLGHPQYIRFINARDQLLRSGYYVPLQELSGQGMRAFQTDPQIASNYAQASGLAHFFMHYNGGQYREALVSLLADLYSGDARVRQNAPGLDERTGVSYGNLDAQYREYLEQQEQDVSETDTPATTALPLRIRPEPLP